VAKDVVRLFISLRLLALGPGLLVNLLFKNLWGRPRPQSLDMFNSSLHFDYVPAIYMQMTVQAIARSHLDTHLLVFG